MKTGQPVQKYYVLLHFPNLFYSCGKLKLRISKVTATNEHTVRSQDDR